MRYRVAVLVALYKAGQFLEAKLETLSRQTAFKDAQIVLLNCQNLDNERDTYNRFIQEHNNVFDIYYNEHIRLYASWNDGILATNSDYICNSNADDMLHPAYLEKLIDLLDNNNDIGVALCNSLVTDVPNQLWPEWSNIHGEIISQYPLSTAGPCPMYRRELHIKHGMYHNYRTISDALMWHDWHSAGVKFANVNEHLVLYYHAPGHNLEVRTDAETGQTFRDLDLQEHYGHP